MSFRSDLHDWLRDTLDLPTRPVRISGKPVYPALDYTQIYADEPIDHSGRFGLVRRHMQIDVWARNDKDVDDISNRLRQLLNGFRGMIGDSDIVRAEYAGERDLADPDPSVFRRAIDFYITEREPVAAS